MKRVIRLSERDLTRIVKRIIKETEMDSEMNKGNSGWKKVFDSLSVYKNPKIIKWNDYEEGAMSSLNWGSHKTGGYSWGLSIGNDTGVSFQSKDTDELETFDAITSENSFDVDDNYGGTLRLIDVDYNDPNDVNNSIQLIKSALNVLS